MAPIQAKRWRLLMSDGDIGALRSRYDVVASRLEGERAAAEREEIKSEIIALYKETEQELLELRALREDVKQLVERWKQLTLELESCITIP